MGMAWRRRKRDTVPEESRSADLLKAWLESSAYQAHYSTGAGVPVTLDSALRTAAVWSCVRCMASEIAALPVDVVSVLGGRRKQVDPQPSIVRRPDPTLSRRAWLGQVAISRLAAGNAYGEITAFDPQGRPAGIVTVHPQSVRWVGNQMFIGDKPRDPWPVGTLWHLPVSFLLQPGCRRAMAPIEYGRDAFGTAIAAERFGSDFFTAGAAPVAVLRTAKKDLTPADAEAAKDAVRSATRRREPLVLGSMWESLDKFEVDPSKTQFIDLLRFEVEQACRFFGVPPAMVYASISGAALTYANVTDHDLMFLKHSLGLWLLDIEDALTEMIPRPQIVKFNVDAVLRMDKRARSEEHEIRLRTKTRSVNEVRRLEDEDPFDDPRFDEPGIPPDDTGGAGSEGLVRQLQQIYLAVGKVISVEEAREILNRSGAGLDVGAFKPDDGGGQ